MELSYSFLLIMNSILVSIFLIVAIYYFCKLFNKLIKYLNKSLDEEIYDDEEYQNTDNTLNNHTDNNKISSDFS